MLRSAFLAIGLALLLGSFLPPQRPRGSELETPVVRVPMDTRKGHVGLLEVYVNGEGPLAFNLDTYAIRAACVDRELAERLDLRKIGTTLNGDGSGRTETRDVVWIDELRVGGATFRGVQALVDDYTWVPKVGGGSIDGLLGYYLFGDLLLELDYPEGEVVLSRGELPEPAPGNGVVRSAPDRPDVPIRIGDQELTASLDSGAASGLSLPLEWAERLELKSKPVVTGHARSVYSNAEVLGAKLEAPLAIGGHSIEGLQASFSELFGLNLVGHEVLSRYSVTFDQRNRRIRFEVPRRPTVAIEHLTRWVGTYEIAPGDLRTIRLNGDRLTSQRVGGPIFELRPLSVSEFEFEGAGGVRAEFLSDVEGRVTGMRLLRPGAEPERARRVREVRIF